MYLYTDNLYCSLIYGINFLMLRNRVLYIKQIYPVCNPLKIRSYIFEKLNTNIFLFNWPTDQFCLNIEIIIVSSQCSLLYKF